MTKRTKTTTNKISRTLPSFPPSHFALRRASRVVFVLVAVLCVALFAVARSAKADGGGTFEKQAIATAGALSNMRNTENSIRFLSNELLGAAIAEAGKHPHKDKHSTIIFTSVPTTFIDGKTDSKNVSCDDRQKETTASPIVYSDKTFSGSDELMDWISDFSQGRETEGRNLYRRCSGSCSPQYKYYIHPKESGFNVTAEVICGKARNKSDDLYQLTVTVQANHQ